MKHPVKPCADCPYRLDAPAFKWHRSEFRKVLAAERSYFGAVFACHQHKERAPDDRGVCAGWATDQKRRGLPSIALRVALIRDTELQEAFERLDPTAVGLYPDVFAMCRANGVRP